MIHAVSSVGAGGDCQGLTAVRFREGKTSERFPSKTGSDSQILVFLGKTKQILYYFISLLNMPHYFLCASAYLNQNALKEPSFLRPVNK